MLSTNGKLAGILAAVMETWELVESWETHLLLTSCLVQH